ncbi:hypothetical protein PGTUg99_015026 [Puccinia graminis f. sp. tritici]|uniref:Uncharacterized protein n=1 Tax=Puccinia graminis f. sp. tritici TaxID=56615 RepID=A0A5B0SGP0_PUCGR|nr:hypothetical protein PGTUg99_015026 [Puccinia graminis f. sp. tritici]
MKMDLENSKLCHQLAKPPCSKTHPLRFRLHEVFLLTRKAPHITLTLFMAFSIQTQTLSLHLRGWADATTPPPPSRKGPRLATPNSPPNSPHRPHQPPPRTINPDGSISQPLHQLS